MDVNCWHGQTDTLVRMVRRTGDEDDFVDVWLTAGVYVGLDAADQPDPPSIQVAVTFVDPAEPDPVQMTELTLDDVRARFAAAEKDQLNPDRHAPVRPYSELKKYLESLPNRYFELKKKLRYGTTLEYAIRYTVEQKENDKKETGTANRAPDASTYKLVLITPEFKADDIRFANTPNNVADAHWWILSRTSALTEAGQVYDFVRLDMLNSIDPNAYFGLPRVQFTFPNNDHPMIDIELGPQPGYPLPIVDRNTDTIVLAIPRLNGPPLSHIQVTTKTVDGSSYTPPKPVDLDTPNRYLPTRLLLLNYCIQALNDYFAPPLDAYRPPRTYMQVTMRDERGFYSSRPDRRETGAADGYALTLAAHRFFGVKSQWAFNAGVLALIAHDCPDDLAEICKDVGKGLLVPCNAGFGAHRPAYYQSETNRREIVEGARLIANYLGYHGSGLKAYYPDQRLFKGTRQELDAYAEAGVKYLVLDRSTVCGSPSYAPTQRFKNLEDNGNFLWILKGSHPPIGLLLIEDVFRNEIDSDDDDLTLRGKAAFDLRRRFMQLVVQRTPDVRRPLMVYGDDADKASGNGWFDGDVQGLQYQYNDMYIAFLKWVSSHPWVEAITTESLEPERLGDGVKNELEVLSATDATLDPDGAASVDSYGNMLHFDAWYANWQTFPADWLGSQLFKLSDDLEHDLLTWPRDRRNEAYDLAWLYFLMFTHESFWNKEPVDGKGNTRREVVEPADFVIAESLQQRHAWVFLNASRWASWAARATDSQTYLDAGPLCESDLHWDHDLMTDVVLYNNQVLVVMDRNGGCITNVFVRYGAQPVSVSGHFKAFQYFDTSRQDPSSLNPGISCNGVVLQNTVFTPNHAYVAADVQQSLPIQGSYRTPTLGGGWFDQAWLYPNNFNEYVYARHNQTARFTYQRSKDKAPKRLDRNAFADYCIEDRVRRGRSARGPGLVWHDRKVAEFWKEFTLEGRKLSVRYYHVPQGHVVSNEFCLDLLNAVMRKEFQKKVVSPGMVTLATRRAAVSVELDRRCAFSPAVLLPDGKAAEKANAVSDYLMLHRVLTDNLQIVCPRGGDFAYTINFD